MIEEQWIAYGKLDLKVEAEQLQDEGAYLPDDFAHQMQSLLTFTGPENQTFRSKVQNLLEQSAYLPTKSRFPYHEPSDLAAIQAARPSSKTLENGIELTDKEFYNRVYGAWLGRCSGCLLGIPIEGLFIQDFWPYLKHINQYPLNRYLDSSIPDELKAKYTFVTDRGYIDEIDHMVENDDTNYTVISLAVMEKYGWDFQPEDVAAFWLNNLPAYHTFTAERVAYRNFLLLNHPPDSATYCNPYREWIGAQIRGDFWGYVSPGNPAKAAELAWRDACISHVKNGIYGEMWVAAMCSAAAVLDTPRQVLEAGVGQIPENCRLAANIHEVIEWYDSGKDVLDALALIHQRWDDTNPHHWCHTLSNAQIVTLGLLWGENDFEKSISWAVTAGIDTDCNGATVGSVIGMLHGANKLPSKWIDPLNDRLDTGISGYQHVRISDLAHLTLEFAKKSSFTPNT
ncbi:MAG: ADP-ribosylglycohydrolase family protein [Brevefilum sp.]|nr:ADP-ribosylglycohydrolase family protein [Brevefilum sp.]